MRNDVEREREKDGNEKRESWSDREQVLESVRVMRAKYETRTTRTRGEKNEIPREGLNESVLVEVRASHHRVRSWQ